MVVPRITRGNKWGIRGVDLHSRKGEKSPRYRVRIVIENATIELGTCKSLEEAARIRHAGEKRYRPDAPLSPIFPIIQTKEQD